MDVPVAINRLAAFLKPGSNPEQTAGISGMMKLFLRWENYSVPARDAALVLTPSEQGVLLRGARRFLVRWFSRAFLVGAVLDFARGVIAPNEERKSLTTRIEIIEAHIVKGGPLWSRAIGVGEQVLFILTDNLGEVMQDTAAAILSDVAGTTVAAQPGANIFDRGYYTDLASPVANLDQVDSIFEVAPAIPLQPAILPFPSSVETFPAGPMPSWGQRR